MSTGAARLLHLQRTAGNQAIQRTLAATPVQRGAGMSATGGVGRARAVQVLSRCDPGTAGSVMLGPVTALYRTIGNIGSGRIGAHYEQMFPLLNQPVTYRLLLRIAIQETDFWNLQPGFPGLFGSALSSRSRAWILLKRANRLGIRFERK